MTAHNGVHAALEQPVNSTSVPTAARLSVVDALRGFALFGVIVSNLAALSGLNPSAHPELVQSVGDRVAFFGVLQLGISGKFMGLFSLLFGLGFALMLDRQMARGQPFVARYLRRTVLLFLFGVVSFMLGNGDVLHLYAILALVLLFFRNASDRTLLVAGVLSLFAGGVSATLQPLLYEYLPSPRGLAAKEDVFKRAGDLIPLLAFRLEHLWARLWPALLGNYVLAFFFAGVLIARSGLLTALDTKQRFLKRATLACAVLAPVGLALNGPLQSLMGVWAPPLYFVGHTGFYFFGFLFLWSRAGRAQRWLAQLAPAGRMALTWYLSAPVIAYGIYISTGAFQQVGAMTSTLIGIGLFLAMLVTSHWWFGQYQSGPAEWLWRTLTYGHRQFMRLMTRYRESIAHPHVGGQPLR